MGAKDNSEIDLSLMDDVFEKYQGQKAAIIPILQKAQTIYGYVPPQVLDLIARRLGVSIGKVYGVATFYAFLSVKPRGKHVIRICKSVPCYLRDAPMIVESVEKALGIRPGETTADGMVSFELTNCIGACDQAPAMLVDDEVFGNLTPGKISEILKSHS